MNKNKSSRGKRARTYPPVSRRVQRVVSPHCKATTAPIWYNRHPGQCANKATSAAGYCRLHDPLLRAKRRDFDKELAKLHIDAQSADERVKRIAKRISEVIAEKKRCADFLACAERTNPAICREESARNE